MTAKALLEIALRVIGIWYLVAALSALAIQVSYLASGMSGFLNSVLIAFIFSFVAQLALGVALILLAPAIAGRFYPSEIAGGESRMALGPGDVYRIACFVLGVYVLVQSAVPATRFAVEAVQTGWNAGAMLVDAVATLVYVVSGLLLVFGSHRIGEVLSNLRYDPDTIPKQQFSIAILLVILLLIAVVLGVIRWTV